MSTLEQDRQQRKASKQAAAARVAAAKAKVAAARAQKPSTGSTFRPTAGQITQGSKEGHVALDFGGNVGDPVFASRAGTVVNVRNQTTGYGLNIILRSPDGLYETVYAHLSGVNVKVGQSVRAGQVIGAIGATGTKVPHLHYEERRAGLSEVFDGKWSATSAIDPYTFLGLTSAPPTGQAASYPGAALAGIGAALGLATANGKSRKEEKEKQALFSLKVPLFEDLRKLIFGKPKEGIASYPIRWLTIGVGVILTIIALWKVMGGPGKEKVVGVGKALVKEVPGAGVAAAIVK